MSRTLNLADRLLAMGRLFQEMGCTQDALRILNRLAGFRQLSPETAAEAHARLGQLHLRRRRYQLARRHLGAALVHQPHDASYHYLMATAFDQDENGDPQSAWSHYRQSLSLEPNQPNCLSDFGLLALCLGNDEEGLQALRRAVDLAPDDPEIVGKLLEGLCQLERPQEARLTLRAALFRNPRHSGFRKLWSDFRFQQLREQQDAVRREEQLRRELNDEPVVLPYLRPTGVQPPGGTGKRIRRDGASAPLPPHVRWPLPFPDKKHA
jgi:Tfp pilus assembly protein PilF